MDPFSLIESTWWLGIPVALVMGALLGANPAALPIVGTAIGLGSAGALAARGGAIKVAAAFGAGMVVVYTAVGVVAERVDELTESILRPYSGIGYLILGIVISGFALFLLLRPSAFCASCAMPTRRNATMAGAFLAAGLGDRNDCDERAGSGTTQTSRTGRDAHAVTPHADPPADAARTGSCPAACTHLAPGSRATPPCRQWSEPTCSLARGDHHWMLPDRLLCLRSR